MPLICLNDHIVHFMCSVGNLYEKMELTDCVMVTRGGLIHAHKIILAVYSPYFKKLLMNHNGTTSFAFKEVEHNIMKLILDMMYYGETDVPETDVALFTETANLLQITSLRRASLNFSETFSTRNTSDDNNAPKCGVNVLGNVKRNLPVQENGAMCDQDVLHEREIRSNSGIEKIDLQSIHSPETDERNILKEFSEKVNEDRSKKSIQNSNGIANVGEWRDEEDLQDELNPITFVAVPSVSVKSEEVEDEQSTSCISGLQLKNLLEEYPHDCDTGDKVNFKREQEFLSESQIKMENKEEIADNEPKKGNWSANNDPCIYDMEQSFNESSANVEDDKLTDSEPIKSVLGISVLNSDCIVERTQDLKVKFESICEISEFNLKEEESFDADLDLGNSEDIDSISLKPEHEAVNCGEEELSLSGCQQDMKPELDSVCTSKFNTKEARVVLKRINSFTARDKDSKNPVSVDSRGSSMRRRMKSTKNEKPLHQDTREHQEYFNPLQPESALNSQTKCSQPDALRKHTESHTDPKSNTCGLCKKSFQRRIDFERHNLTHTGENPFSCATCEASFSRSSNLKRHIRTHTGEKPFTCATCQASFTQNRTLRRHNQSHTEEKPFTCATCEASFSLKSYLKLHERTHSGDKPFVCDVCKLSFSRSGNLKRHMGTHTGEKTLLGSCPSSFRDAGNLMVLKRFHTGKNIFLCGTCNAIFSKEYDIKRHMRTHTGEKPFTCATCGASFSQNSSLRKHIRTHTGEKPFTCATCEASFSEKSTLITHIRTHTGDKPYVCDVCSASFSRKNFLTKHMRSHTTEIPVTVATSEACYTQSRLNTLDQ